MLMTPQLSTLHTRLYQSRGNKNQDEECSLQIITPQLVQMNRSKTKSSAMTEAKALCSRTRGFTHYHSPDFTLKRCIHNNNQHPSSTSSNLKASSDIKRMHRLLKTSLLMIRSNWNYSKSNSRGRTMKSRSKSRKTSNNVQNKPGKSRSNVLKSCRRRC